MHTELVETTTADGLTLHGAYYAAPSPSDGGLDLDAILLLHGVGGNFYSSTLLDRVTVRCRDHGLAVVSANTRGHDFVSLGRTASGPQRQGAAYETVGQCHYDIAAWSAFLQQRGARHIGLVGHSLGAIKALFAMAHHPAESIRRVVAMSPPRLSYAAFTNGPRRMLFAKTIERAQRHVTEGKPETLIRVTYPFPLLITAAGYLEKYGPDERYNLLGFAHRLPCPVLFTYGRLELDSGSMAFQDLPELLGNLPTASTPLQILTLEEADHLYSGVQDRVAQQIVAWLREA